MNNDMQSLFLNKKGLRQGDTLSVVLFSLVVNMISIFIARAKKKYGQI